MRLKKLLSISLLLSVFLGACDININLDKNKNNDNNTQQNQQQTSNNQNQNVENGTSQSNNQESNPISIDKAKNISYDLMEKEGGVSFKEGDLEYREDKSDDNQIFIESPLFGINGSAKSHIILNRYTGEVIEQDGGPPAPDGPLRPKNGKIDSGTYNILVKYYNNYVYRNGDTVYNYSEEPVPVSQYKEVNAKVWEYIENNMPQ
ncbi:hypothetical protein E2558_08145 [Staphylococcus pragensis]|uniref:Lipoprotein n=1 Tax=Staphylococcus pragensis TaxID=1611836 RepID=A0A4Z1B944_9STAP|nr:hypothetical protein [Staphylococcus pragensis]RTX91982.1 hypothetical protein CD154_01255 [Staphylococcus carnosus]TGN26938.1 hypothetical protein E2558_08145 [Staphylococcus pragensis]GGG93995.1 hypothetical protein GCM10007342_16340 [Staphylococcus pragensis]